MSMQLQYLKEMLVDKNGILGEEEFDRFHELTKSLGVSMEQLLLKRGVISESYFLSLLSGYFGVPAVELKPSTVNIESLEKVSEKYAATNKLIPFDMDGKTLKIAMADPKNAIAVEPLKNQGLDVEVYVSTERAIKRAFILYRGTIEERLNEMIDSIKIAAQRKKGKELSEGDEAVVNFMNTLIDTGVMMGASDIHIEPFEKEIIIRFRIDGILQHIATVSSVFLSPIMTRLKVSGGLRIDEHRVPQDGRLVHETEYETVDIRLSVVPAFWGEKAVMRLLVKETNLFDVNSIGLLDSDLDIVKKHIKKPYGMILVCGPTGSGKTTSLYSFLQEIGFEKIDIVNISTIEDPIEYTIFKVNQLQVNPNTDFSFALGLRSLLRQDPDILMVGEIRDPETANIAVRSALIGRLMLSSLHTNDAIGAIPRLMDMGIEPYIISSTASLVVAQRLVRSLCVFCRESYAPTEEELTQIKEMEDYDYIVRMLRAAGILGKGDNPFEQVRFFRSAGCDKCGNSGYQGRTGVFEILEVTDQLRGLIRSKTDIVTIRNVAMESGSFKTLFVDGIAKVIMGTTDLDEVLKVTL